MNQQAEAWSKWRAANLSSIDMDTIIDSRRNESRFWHAFMDGYEAGTHEKDTLPAEQEVKPNG